MDDDAPILVTEAALRAQVSADTIRAWFDVGKLAGRRTSTGLRLIDRRSLETIILSRVAEKKRQR
jgi:DNA-binding transcriptional MerR regulator